MSNRLWKIGEKPVVIAHRAGGNEAPENSIVAVRNMQEKGFKYIETDLYATSDGVVILHHDPELDRTTDGTGKISDYTWAELSKVTDESGNRLMRLDEVLEEFPDLIFNMDSKENSVVRPLIRTLQRQGGIDQVSLSSFSEMRLKFLRSQLPGVKSSLGTAAIGQLVLAAHSPSSLRSALATGVPGPAKGAEAVQVPMAAGKVSVINPQFIELAHARGLAVHVWTINEETEMNEILDLGVDGIITDEPSLAQRVIDQHWAGRN